MNVKDLKTALAELPDTDDDLEVIVRGTNDDEESVVGTPDGIAVQTSHGENEERYLAIDLDCTPEEDDEDDEETPDETSEG